MKRKTYFSSLAALGHHFDASTSIAPSEAYASERSPLLTLPLPVRVLTSVHIVPCSPSGPKRRSSGLAPNTDAVSISVTAGLITVLLLHEEPRPNPADEALEPGLTGHSKLAQASRAFFSKLAARFLSSEESLESIRARLAQLCTQDHLR